MIIGTHSLHHAVKYRLAAPWSPCSERAGMRVRVAARSSSYRSSMSASRTPLGPVGARCADAEDQARTASPVRRALWDSFEAWRSPAASWFSPAAIVFSRACNNPAAHGLLVPRSPKDGHPEVTTTGGRYISLGGDRRLYHPSGFLKTRAELSSKPGSAWRLRSFRPSTPWETLCAMWAHLIPDRYMSEITVATSQVSAEIIDI